MDNNLTIWDSFWAVHASKNDIYHRFLWMLRFIFSKTYAYYIGKYSGKVEGGKILEVGCGSARTLHYLNEIYSNSDCYAIDLSLPALSIVRTINPTFYPAIGDAYFIPSVGGIFDAVFSIGLIEHFTREQAKQMVVEKIRVARKGGVVAVMVPWISSVYNLIVRKAFGKHWPFGDENPFHRKELADFMTDCGLEDVKVVVIFGTTLLGIGKNS